MVEVAVFGLTMWYMVYLFVAVKSHLMVEVAVVGLTNNIPVRLSSSSEELLVSH